MGLRNNLDGKSEDADNTEVIYKSVTYGKGKQERLIADDKKDCIFLYFSALTADLVMFASASTLSWTSTAFQQLKSTDVEVNPLGVPITSLQESWIVGLTPLGCIIGSLLSGKLADIYGRRKALMLLAVIEIISFVILAFATNIYLYYLTRFLLGIGVGICFTILPIYNGEICEVHNRGKLGCIMGAFAPLGHLYTLSVAPLLSLKVFTVSYTIPLIFVLVSFIFIIPETPIHLVSKDDEENAIKALMKLRRNKSRSAAEKDLIEIRQMTNESSKSGNVGCIAIIKIPVFRKGLIICLGLYFFQQFSGICAILAFIGPIFESSSSNISTYLSSVLVTAVQVIATLAASILVEKLGRKVLLLISLIVSSTAYIMLGLYFYLEDNEFNYIQNLSWLPVTSLMMYLIFYNLGIGPITWAFVSEVFPSSARSTASSITIIFGALSSFFVTFLFPLIIEFTGIASCFWMFGGFCALGAIFVYIIVPETKGKTIEDIQKMLAK